MLTQIASGSLHDFARYAAVLRDALLVAYDTGSHESLEAWYGIYRWLDLFQEYPFHRRKEKTQEQFGTNWPTSLRAFFLRDFAFTYEFFDLLSPLDDVAAAGRILDQIYRLNPEVFEEYRSLALAIALVYDVRSTGVWWTMAVPNEIRPPGLPDPVDAYSFFVSSAKSDQLMMDPRRLTPRELQFAVSLCAPLTELRWAQRQVRTSVSRFDRTYSMIEYDYDRYSPGMRELKLEWPHEDYSLETIWRRGGICGDQAYFASQTGKARGLPTVYFSGAGENGGHAWVGYLTGPGKGWNVEVGRYELNNYVVGHTRDPQTWKSISDHELLFTNDPFHRSAQFRESNLHATFARELWLTRQSSRALRAAQQAIHLEPRNRAAWNLVVEINDKSNRSSASETALNLAAEAFRHYPHVQANYLGTLAERIAARGDLDAAFDLLEKVSRRNRGQQADISVNALIRILRIAASSNDPQLLIRGYRRALSSVVGYAPAGLILRKITAPFLAKLHGRDETQTRILLARTRQRLRPTPGTLADRALQDLEQKLR